MRNLKSMNRFFSLFLAVILVMSVAVVPVSAADNDIYIYDRDANGQFLFMYQSPVTFWYDFNDKYITATNSLGTWHQVYIFTMYNTRTQKHIPTYCTDVDITANKGDDYQRMNLEDSPFSGSAAGQIRRILTDGFYIIPIDGESDADHADRVAVKTAELGAAAGVPDLTTGEAISATQFAIWKAAHGSAFKITQFCRKPITDRRYFMNNTKYGSLCSFDELTTMYNGGEGRETIDGRIKKVYDYLLDLASRNPIEASSMTVSPSSFVELHDPVITEDGNGNYTVTVTVKVKVDMAGNDSLTLSANLGNNTSESVTLSGGTQTETLTINNVPKADVEGDVKLSISGVQTVSGYFYFDAWGDRDASQSMVAYEKGQVPVYAEVIAQENRVLNIKKTIKNSGGKPLAGMIFDIFYVASKEEADTLPKEPSQCEHPKLAEYTLITDENGNASLDLTQQGMPDGIYLVVEHANEDVIKEPFPPFYVDVPHYDDEDGYVNNIVLKVKNEIIPTEEPVIPTGGINLRKVDSDDETKTLAGATFEVYRTANAEESSGAGEISGVTGKVVKVNFYDEKTGETVSSVTSDENGEIAISGLPYDITTGTDYYLVETEAPAGYNMLAAPVKVTINADSQTAEPIHVVNKSGVRLPSTGGVGTTAFTVSGIALVSAACLFLYMNKRKMVET